MTVTIGIDPGSRVGVAVLEDGRLEMLETVSHADAPRLLELFLKFEQRLAERRKDSLRIIIEIPPAHIYDRPGLSRNAMLKVARNVGQCHERAVALAAALRVALPGAEVVERAPVRGGTKLNRAAWDAMFPEWRGKRCSGHSRDAAVLAKMGE
jgi:predicted nuclease with RNAse H fold